MLRKKINTNVKRLRPFINQRTALLFYRSVIQCNFDYCSTVWTNCSKSHLNQLQILQNRSLRIVMNVDYMFPTTLLYETLKLDRLQIRWSKLLARTMYRAIHKLCPPYLSSIFSFREAVYCTRSGSHKLKLIQPKTNYGKRSLTYRGAKLWNELDYPLSTPVSIDIFKRHLHDLNGHPNLMNRITIIIV